MWADWQMQNENIKLDEISWFNDCCSVMFSLDFDGFFLTIDIKSLWHFVLDTINW